jgi:hypothetical protein
MIFLLLDIHEKYRYLGISLKARLYRIDFYDIYILFIYIFRIYNSVLYIFVGILFFVEEALSYFLDFSLFVVNCYQN